MTQDALHWVLLASTLRLIYGASPYSLNVLCWCMRTRLQHTVFPLVDRGNFRVHTHKQSPEQTRRWAVWDSNKKGCNFQQILEWHKQGIVTTTNLKQPHQVVLFFLFCLQWILLLGQGVTRLFMQTSGWQAHLILSDYSHATAASSIGCFEDDGKAICLGKHLCLLQAGDRGICSWDHRHT